MPKMDYHLHTRHSMDSRQTMEALCQAALLQGLREICVTDHYEPHHPLTSFNLPPQREALLADLEEARLRFPSLSIRLGMEIGDHPQWHEEIIGWLDEWPLDYRLLSLHLVEGLDPYFSEYFERYGQDRATAYDAYARALLRSLKSWKPEEYDAFAHIGYVSKKAPFPGPQRSFRWSDAPDTLDELLRLLAQQGKALEVNTSGYAFSDQPLPGPDILRRFRELGGEFIVFGSDAHVPERVGQFFDRALALVLACGFRHTLSFQARQARVVSLEG